MPTRSKNSSGSSKGNRKQTPHHKRLYTPLLLLGVLGLVLLAAGAAAVWRSSAYPHRSAELRTVNITPGMTVEEIGRLLRSEGVISSVWGFRRHVVSRGLDRELKSGSYVFPPGLTLAQAVDVLHRGYLEQGSMYVFPGFTRNEIAQRIADAVRINLPDVIEAIDAEAARRRLPSAEGYFFPGRYVFSLDGFSLSKLISLGFDRFMAWESEYWEEIEAFPYGGTEELVIVASMVQREAGSIWEMPFIAGIIWKRLELGMPLGIDATTRYELNDWQNPLRREDLERMTPFNTRRNVGLPPTAISSPGIDALLASLRPQESPYLYYLHDREGGIHFSATYTEHLEKIEQHLR